MSDIQVPPPTPPAGAPTPPAPAPGNRLRPRFVVAIAIAALMVVGILGLVGAAVLGDSDDDPTGDALGPIVNVDEPATAPPAEAVAPVQDSAASDPPDRDDSTEPESAATEVDSDDDFSGELPTTAATIPPIETAVAVDAIEEPDDADLPEPGDAPVEFPVQVTTPAPPSTFPAVPFAELAISDVPQLAGWTVSDRSSDHLALSDGDQLIEVFTIDGVATADDALEQFYDDVKPDLEELTRSPITRLGAPSSRFVSVAGSEYVATSAGQQGSSTMTGAIVAGVRADGTAVVITSSRAGTSSEEELAHDADLLRAVLAHL